VGEGGRRGEKPRHPNQTRVTPFFFFVFAHTERAFAAWNPITIQKQIAFFLSWPPDILL